MNDITVIETLAEIRDWLKMHPAYDCLTEEEELEIGGDTAELSYLVRIANEALRDYDEIYIRNL
jgi:hypothetical protein